MRAIRPGADVPDGSAAAAPADPLAAAAELRWSRPDLTAALADHVLESSAAADDRDRWLAAAGWAVHARSATGDGRDTAADVIGCLPDWGPGVLDGPAAGRLRVELALVAVNAEETAVAAALLEPVVAEEGPAELRGDAFGVLARCAVDEAPDQVEAALACAERAWEELGSPQRELGGAAVALVAAAAHRRSGRAPLAAERAADGLAELERARQGAGSGPRSGHLAAALAAEWILSLLDAGDAEQARQGCAELAPRLEHSRPSRQLARLRLAVARTNAVGSTAAETAAHTLGQAVRDAAECDAPDLEALCCSALGAVYEKAGRPDFALTTVERGVAAQRRDRSRADRFRAALATLPVRVAPASSERPDPADTTRPLPVGPVAGEPVTALLPTTGRVGAEAARSGAPARERSRHGLAVDRAWRLGEYAETADDASPSRHTDGETRPDRDRGPERPTTARPEPSTRPDLAQADQRPGGRSGVWDVDWDETDQSPIGDSLMRSMRDTRHDRPSQPAGERRTAAPSSAESAPPARTRRAEPTGSPDAARTELLRVTEADSAPAHDGPEPQDPAPGTAAASRHRLDTGMNPVVPTRPRTAAEELDAHRTAARRKEQAPSAFSAEWLAAELADLERIWERISQPAVRPETSSDAAPGATAGDAAGGASAAPVDEDRADEHDTEHDAEYDPADRADRADADADRAGSGRRRADRSGANGSGANGSGVNGSTPGRAPRGRRRSADLGDSEPDGAVAGTAGASRARDERDAADPTAPAGGGRARSGSAARSGVAAELTRPADGTESHSTSDSTGGSPGSSNGTTAEGVATAWTMTRPAGRRRRAEPEVGSDGPADAEDEQTGRRSSGARSAPGSASRGAPRTGRRRADADDPAEAGSGRADAAEDETTAAGGAQDPRDRPDGRGADRAGRRRADPMTAADGAPSANGHSANGHSANGRSAGNPVAEKTGGSGRGARQAANARAETAMFPAVRPEPASAADAALFGPLPAELLEPVLAEPATAPAAPAEPTSPPPPKAARRDADGCVVGIDIAREGRRLVGRRSAEVLRTVAEVLRGSLPPEGRIDEDEPGVLRVSAPGWGRGAATGWMRSRLPGVLDGFAVEVDPSGMNLRAAVRDADGPVGAQLLQRLDPPGGDALGGEVPGGKVPGAATPGGASRRGAGTGPPLARPAGPGGGRRRADDRPEPERAAPQAFTRPVAGRHGSGETGVMASVDPGRHEQDAAPTAGAAAGARPDPGKGAAAPRGRRRAAETPAGGADPQEPKGDEQDPPAGGAPARKRVDASTEGLGLADLLAGALAEYRGI